MADGRHRAWRWPTRPRRSIPAIASQHAAVVATGRSDFPNQINNVLAFPGLLPRPAGRRRVATSPPPMLVAAAEAIADRVADDELNASYIIPSVFDPHVAPTSPPRSPRRVVRSDRAACTTPDPPESPAQKGPQ